MGIDRRRAHVRMPLQFLHRAHVGARLQQVRGKAVVHGGAQAIVFVTKSLTDLVQQSYGKGGRRVSWLNLVLLFFIQDTCRKATSPFCVFSSQFRPKVPDMACGLVRYTLRYAS